MRLLDAFDVLKPYQVYLWIIGGGFLTGFICAAVGHWHLGLWATYLALALVGVWVFPIVIFTVIFFVAVLEQFPVSFRWPYKAVGFLAWTFLLAFFIALFLVELLGH